MSTPSGKPFDPLDLSPYAPKRARERSEPAREPVAGERQDKGARGDEATAAPAYVPRAALRADGAGERALAADAGAPVQPPQLPQPQLRSEAVKSAEKSADKPVADQSAADLDLARLESSLQWLQHESSVGRLPRAVQLPPVSGLRPVAPESARSRSEQFINGVRVPPSLAPERLRPPPPMRQRRDNLRGPLRVLMASVIAAPIAYYFAVGNLMPNPASTAEPGHQSALASFASRLVASSDYPLSKEQLRPGEAEAYNTVVSSRNKLIAEPAPGPTLASAESKVAPPPIPVPDPAPAVRPPVRELDAQSVKLLIQQGEQFVASGDLVAARLVYRRAAESGSAAAALALGATFDPVVLAKIGVKGMGADIAKARSWYEKAKEFGSPDAPRRLEMLANR
jgi:hypothetical protein